MNVRFSVTELQRMIQQAELHGTDIVEVQTTPTGIGTLVKVKAVKDGESTDYIDVSDYDNW